MSEIDEFLPRHLTPALQEALATARVVNLVGPRQVGKTTLDRREIDILIDGGHRLALIEAKTATTVAADDFKHLKWFATDGPGRGRSTVGIVFYLGQEKLTMGEGRFALPLSSLWASVTLN